MEVLRRERYVLDENAFAKIVIWRVPRPVRGSGHRFKYCLTLVADGQCVSRYDNEAGKGDHRHIGDVERVYKFVSYNQLLSDFWADIERWRRR
jgi:hypothetical protein